MPRSTLYLPSSSPFYLHHKSNTPSQREIQSRYSTHRTARAAQQRTALLSPTFPGVTIDPILARLAAAEPGYTDPRHCLVLWARPPARVRTLVTELQRRLTDVIPSMSLFSLSPSRRHLLRHSIPPLP